MARGFVSDPRRDIPSRVISVGDNFQTESVDTVDHVNVIDATLSTETKGPPTIYQVWYEPFATRRSMQIVYVGQPARDTATEMPRVFRDYVNQLITDDEYQWGDAQNPLRAYRSRIDELIEFGLQEGIVLNRVSERDFWSYVTAASHTRAAGIVLTDEGNLRAVWNEGTENRLAIEFLGDRQVEYVIFRRRNEEAPVSRVVGTDSIEGIEAQIRAFDLGFLVRV